ncbi:MAG: type II toxin-antitoxin system VapB family antitoxin [Spirochaetia bacterium]
MKTTVDIDNTLVQEAMQIYGVSTKTRIIEMGLEELIAAHKRKKLAEAFGSETEIQEPRRRRQP